MDPLETFKAEDRDQFKSLNYSTSGRTAWQRRHKKGKFGHVGGYKETKGKKNKNGMVGH